MIDLHEKWIFIHIQKTGGNSIRDALLEGHKVRDPNKHRTSTDLRALYGGAAWDQCFTFAFVRNPWDRLVSWWSSINAMRPRFEKQPDRLNEFQRYILGNARTFDDFLRLDAMIDDVQGRKSVYMNQCAYLTERIDFIGRYETLVEDFAKVAHCISRPEMSLGRVGPSEHSHYRDYYEPETVQLVEERYADDIMRFGYSF